jgi:hypothetical protein
VTGGLLTYIAYVSGSVIEKERHQEGTVRLSRSPLIELEGSLETGFDLPAGEGQAYLESARRIPCIGSAKVSTDWAV